MKADLRAIIAYTAGCAILKNSFAFIFDQFQDKVVKLEGRFDNTFITIIDIENNQELMGTVSGKELTIINSACGTAIKINLNGNKFTGTISNAKGFNGLVEDRIVKLYDYDEGKYYNFCLINNPRQHLTNN